MTISRGMASIRCLTFRDAAEKPHVGHMVSLTALPVTGKKGRGGTNLGKLSQARGEFVRRPKKNPGRKKGANRGKKTGQRRTRST